MNREGTVGDTERERGKERKIKGAKVRQEIERKRQKERLGKSRRREKKERTREIWKERGKRSER